MASLLQPLLPNTKCPAFIKKLKGMRKSKKKHTSEETKQSWQADSDIIEILSLSDLEFKIAILIAKHSKEKRGQYVRRDDQCKQRDENFKKVI